MSFRINKKVMYASLATIVLLISTSIVLTFFITKNHYLDEIAYIDSIGWELDSAEVDGDLTVGEHVIFTIELSFPTGGYSILPPVIVFSDEYLPEVLWIKVSVIQPTGLVTHAVVYCSIQQFVIFPSSGNWTVRINNLTLEVEIN